MILVLISGLILDLVSVWGLGLNVGLGICHSFPFGHCIEHFGFEIGLGFGHDFGLGFGLLSLLSFGLGVGIGNDFGFGFRFGFSLAFELEVGLYFDLGWIFFVFGLIFYLDFSLAFHFGI